MNKEEIKKEFHRRYPKASGFIPAEDFGQFIDKILQDTEEKTLKKVADLWNEHCKEYVPSDKYWADRFAIKLSKITQKETTFGKLKKLRDSGKGVVEVKLTQKGGEK